MKKILLKSLGLALAIPLAYMIIQVAMYEGSIAYNLPLQPLYDGHEHYLFEYASRAIIYEESFYNLLASLALRFVATYMIVHSRGRRGVIEALIVPFLARVLLVFYVAYRGETSIVIRVPNDLFVPAVGSLGGFLSILVASLRKPKPIFQRLKEAGFEFEPHRLGSVEIPHRCPYCGAEIHSNADVCRKCGRDLRSYYAQKIPKPLKKYLKRFY